MSDQILKVGRRQFLRGVGGFSLALPFLPSLNPDPARASEGEFPRRFVALTTDHGGILTPNMFPDPSTLTRSRQYAGREIRAGALNPRVTNGRASLSAVLTADAGRFTQGLAEKMNVLQGVDIPFYIGHHTGGHLGNFARNDGNGDDGKAVRDHPRPTIDQIMAWSDSFYADLSQIRERAMIISNRYEGNVSYNYTDPVNKTGDLQRVATERSSLNLFNKIFVPAEDADSARPPVVDRVLENYRRLRQSNRRISAEDRRRLDEHMTRISELQRRVNATVSCQDVPTPSHDSRDIQHDTSDFGHNPGAMREYWQLYNDVIATAFTCGTSRVAVLQCKTTFSEYQGDWHQEIAHQAKDNPQAQSTILEAHQRFFEDVFIDLISKLDVEEAPGVSVLDNTLVAWSQESGNFTHSSYSIPIVTAGSAGGYFSTGNYVDYRDLTKTQSGDIEDRHPGLFYNQWLGNVLMSMNVPRIEFERDGMGGYGYFYIGQQGWYQQDGFYPNSMTATLSEKMPYITS